MHVWLASYPRSGNSLMGLLLAQSFGIIRNRARTDEGTPHERELAASHLNRSITITKTHDAPENDDPAIYVVRDGRSAVVSYRHFHRDLHEKEVSFRQLITAETGMPLHWTAHFRAWDPLNRPNTLFLRYEQVVADSQGAVDEVSRFLGIPAVENFDVDFKSAHAKAGKLIRKGSDAANIAELTGSDLAFFDETHGPLMRELGYYEKRRPIFSLSRIFPNGLSPKADSDASS